MTIKPANILITGEPSTLIIGGYFMGKVNSFRIHEDKLTGISKLEVAFTPAITLNTDTPIALQDIDNSGFLSSIEAKNPTHMTVEEKRAAVLENNIKLKQYQASKIKDTGPTLPKIDPHVIMEELGAEEFAAEHSMTGKQLLNEYIIASEYLEAEAKDQLINEILSYGTSEDIKNLAKLMSQPAKSPENITTPDKATQKYTDFLIEEMSKKHTTVKEMVESAVKLAKADADYIRNLTEPPSPKDYLNPGDYSELPKPPPKRDPGPGKTVAPKHQSLWKKIKKYWI